MHAFIFAGSKFLEGENLLAQITLKAFLQYHARINSQKGIVLFQKSLEHTQRHCPLQARLPGLCY
jgi:hypothetical protein